MPLTRGYRLRLPFILDCSADFLFQCPASTIYLRTGEEFISRICFTLIFLTFAFVACSPRSFWELFDFTGVMGLGASDWQLCFIYWLTSNPTVPGSFEMGYWT